MVNSSSHRSPAGTLPTTVAESGGLVTGLVDDAGLFPPEELPMDRAVARHRQDLAAASPVLSHRFICPALRLDELRSQLTAGDHFEVSMISALVPDAVAAAVTAIDADPRLSLAALEGVLPTDWAADPNRVIAAVAALAADVPAYLEIPLSGGVGAAVRFLADQGWSAKIRCGGVRTELFPAAEQLATAIETCVAAGVAFKATAGLHHAVRYRDPATGFTHHGFLNILVAVGRSVAGRGPDAVGQALLSTDGDALVAEARTIAEAGVDARGTFLSYGSCSTADPINDLIGLGLLTPTPA